MVQIRKNAFTLVELLVVISIIALLVSILLPALNKAREQAKLVVCKAVHRSIGQAILIYADDYDGHCIPGNFWNGITIMAPLGPNGEPYPCHEGHLLAGDYLPIPTSDDTVIYCPGGTRKVGNITHYDMGEDPLYNQRDFKHNWQWPIGSLTPAGTTGGSGIVDNHYIFRASMDGGGGPPTPTYAYGSIKGIAVDKITKHSILIDATQYFHPPTTNILFGDGHIDTFEWNTTKGELVQQWFAANIDHYSDAYRFMMLDDLFSVERLGVISPVWSGVGTGTIITNDDLMNEPLIW